MIMVLNMISLTDKKPQTMGWRGRLPWKRKLLHFSADDVYSVDNPSFSLKKPEVLYLTSCPHFSICYLPIHPHPPLWRLLLPPNLISRTISPSCPPPPSSPENLQSGIHFLLPLLQTLGTYAMCLEQQHI